MLALAGCATALALPSAAGARPIDYHPLSPQVAAAVAASNTIHPHGRPAAFAEQDAKAHYQSMMGVGGRTTKTDAQGSVAATSTHAFSLPAGFQTDAQTPGVPPASTQTRGIVVREVRTVTHDSNHTLALVLASVALGIALCGSAYAVIRTTRIQRRVLGSNS